MECILCGKTSINAKIDLFPLSDGARKMLQRRLAIEPNEGLASNGVCPECLDLSIDERKKLAEKAIKNE